MATNKTVLLTLGRLPVALELARAFAASGWRVVVADPWPMHLLRMSRSVSRCRVLDSPRSGSTAYCEQLARIAKEESADLIIPVSEETLYVSSLRDRGLAVFSQGFEQSLELHDKARFIRLAARMNLPVPQTALASESPDFIHSLPYVSKPRYSCSGRGVAFHPAGAAFDSGTEVVLQEQLRGEHRSIFCVAIDGVMATYAVYRPVVVDGSVAIAFESVGNNEAILRWSEAFVEATKHTGFISFDFIVEENGRALPIECNPRATSGIHFLPAATLVNGIVGEHGPAQRQVTAGRYLQESYSCFTRLLASIFSRHKFQHVAATMRRSTDITWRRDDPWPFLLMMVNSWRIIRTAMSRDHNFASASVADVEWRPDDSP